MTTNATETASASATPIGAPAPGPIASGPTGSGDNTSLYATREPIYPRKVSGPFRTLKTVGLWVLFAIFYLGPWLRWDRGGGAPDQAILLDLAGRRGYIFGLEIWPQEVYYLTGLLIIAAVVLFFSTALFGRVWCGFACFQTVYTDLFMHIERWVEGERNARIKLDRGPWTGGKVAKKAVKHLAWALVAFVTAYTFLLYFQDAFRATDEMVGGLSGGWTYSLLALLTFTTYIMAGWAREQVCIYMCPYARFQAAMMDEHSMIVSYEEWRGEPRGKLDPAKGFENRGHCVDCRMCVQACPTGVDIRLGQQLACINCALCVDACNSVMERFKLPHGLITYDSVANQVARSRGEPQVTHILRARTWIYVAVLVAVMAVMAYGLSHRSTLEINVLRDRAPLFVALSDGGIRNGYTFKILNMDAHPATFTLSTEGIDGAALSVIGYGAEHSMAVDLPAKGDAVNTFRVLVRAERGALDGRSTPMNFVLTRKDGGVAARHATVFAGPAR